MIGPCRSGRANHRRRTIPSLCPLFLLPFPFLCCLLPHYVHFYLLFSERSAPASGRPYVTEAEFHKAIFLYFQGFPKAYTVSWKIKYEEKHYSTHWMFPDAKKMFSWYGDQTFFFPCSKIFFLAQSFLTCSEKNFLEARKNNTFSIGKVKYCVKNKCFAIIRRKKCLGIRNHLYRRGFYMTSLSKSMCMDAKRKEIWKESQR